ncbi:MAG: LPXTG cell wall anchor domain-containing protein [Actinobacteria bacterium]|nr:LPXTG cell wall anchor domain-containing protein [Actinomycetota bacterium]
MHQNIDEVRNSHPIRSAIAATSLAVGAAILLAPATAGAQELPTEGEPTVTAQADGPITSIGGNIKVDDKTAPSEAACITAEQAFIGTPLLAPPAWQIYPVSTDDQFILNVVATAPLCTPMSTTAAIYNMPNGGEWPQQVGEQVSFTLQNPGEITVTFEKQCNRVQFDLLWGSGAPSPINVGFDHQLLFPFRLDTAIQYFASASKCQPATTTTTTTTTPGAVLNTTTTAAVRSATTVPSDVLAATTVPAGVGNTGTNRGAALAATGSSSLPMTFAGVAMVLVGGSLVATRRRKLSNEA